MAECCVCGAKCGTQYKKTSGNFDWRNPDSNFQGYLCKECWKKECAKGIGCLLAPFKLVIWVIKILSKILLNKWILTLLTCGFSWLLWKGLDKIYGK